jgi:hypothetical protein
MHTAYMVYGAVVNVRMDLLEVIDTGLKSEVLFELYWCIKTPESAIDTC